MAQLTESLLKSSLFKDSFATNSNSFKGFPANYNKYNSLVCCEC